jgi:hypothetical protein
MTKKHPRRVAPVIQRFVKRRLRQIYLEETLGDAIRTAKSWRSVEWPQPVQCCSETHKLLKKYYLAYMAMRYRKALSPENKKQLAWKSSAHDFMRTKKAYKST